MPKVSVTDARRTEYGATLRQLHDSPRGPRRGRRAGRENRHRSRPLRRRRAGPRHPVVLRRRRALPGMRARLHPASPQRRSARRRV